MGAITRYVTFQRCPSEKELFRSWAATAEEDAYERGHESYSGSLHHAHLSVSRTAFKTEKEASQHADSDAVQDAQQKGTALAFRYGDPSKVFPLSAADKALVLRRTALQREFDEVENSVLKRFVASKSASKKCPHCDSVISKKSRVHLASENYAKKCERLKGFELRDYVHEQTACPACGYNLLLTDTDIKKRESLKVRLKDVSGKAHEAEQAFREKSEDYGYVIVAVVSS
jgi:DNA-directed RNA polymerase subunit RPC12/RpoP